MADELLDLFANVPGIQDFAAPPPPPPANGEGLTIPGVTDEQVAAYFQNRMSTNPQFRSGQGAPPPVGGVEDGGMGGTGEVVPGRADPPAPQVEPSAPQTDPAPTTTPPPADLTPTPALEPSPISPQDGGAVPPGTEPPPAEEFPDEIQWGTETIARDRLNAWRAFQRQVDADPQLQAILRQYFEQGQVPPQQPYPGYPPIQPGPFQAPPTTPPIGQPAPVPYQQPEQPQLQQPPLPQLPQLTQDDLADPAVAALYSTIQQQNQILAAQQQQFQAMAQQQQSLATETQQRQMQEQAAILNRVSSSFAAQHNLDATQLAQVQQVAGRLQVIPSLLQGIDPTTGMPTRPDPLSAVERALEIAYSQIPEFQSRREQEVIARFTADQERKRKLSALSGSNGSVPRTTPTPTTAEGRQKALIGEVASMFNGTWSEPQN